MRLFIFFVPSLWEPADSPARRRERLLPLCGGGLDAVFDRTALLEIDSVIFFDFFLMLDMGTLAN